MPSDDSFASSANDGAALDLDADLLDQGDRLLAGLRIGRRELPDDLGHVRRFGDHVKLLLAPLVLAAQRVVGLVQLRGHVAADDLLQRDRLAHLPLQLVARQARLREGGVELGVGREVVLLLDAGHRDLDLFVGGRNGQFLGPLLEQLLADEVLEHALLHLGQVGRVVRGLRQQREPAVELGLRDEPVVDPDDDLLDELRRREAGGGGKTEDGDEERGFRMADIINTFRGAEFRPP